MIGYVSETSLAWAAGFFDGEGTVGATLISRESGRRQRHRTIWCSIGQVDREVLDRFREAVGVGTVKGPYEQSRRQPIHYFSARNIRDVRRIYAALSPYLGSVKLAQFKKSIEAYEQYNPINRAATLRCQEIREFLNVNPGASQRAIAAHFGISQARVNQVMSHGDLG